MKAERWRQIETLFHAARELKPGERPEFLAKACAGDEELRREVGSLLIEHDGGGSVLGDVVTDLAAEWSQEQEPPRIGQTLGHFRILSQLGKGGMGEVIWLKTRAFDGKSPSSLSRASSPRTKASWPRSGR